MSRQTGHIHDVTTFGVELVTTCGVETRGGYLDVGVHGYIVIYDHVETFKV